VIAGLYHRRACIAGIALLLVLAVLTGCGSGPAPWTPGVETTDQAVLICWDGSQRAHVQGMLADGRLPNLQQLIGEGGFAGTDITDHITETFTGHLEMLTGYPPGGLGTRNLNRFEVVPHELTVFDRLERHFGPQTFTTVWLTSKKTKLPALPGLLWSDTKPHVDVWDGDVERTNRKTGPLALGYVQQYARPGAPIRRELTRIRRGADRGRWLAWADSRDPHRPGRRVDSRRLRHHRPWVRRGGTTAQELPRRLARHQLGPASRRRPEGCHPDDPRPVRDRPGAVHPSAAGPVAVGGAAVAAGPTGPTQASAGPPPPPLSRRVLGSTPAPCGTPRPPRPYGSGP
jgi:hypothetical protein